MKIKKFFASFIASMLLVGGVLAMTPQTSDQEKTPTEAHSKKSKKKADKTAGDATEKSADTAKSTKKSKKEKKEKAAPQQQ
ncbi:MAG: hypothetical protein J2P31_01120 [Blastocatellia bacterium]|nr:hypothetical protein [Blastocatellia bacterium]